MKNIIKYTLAIFMVLALYACSTSSDENQPSIDANINFDSRFQVNGKAAEICFGGTISTYGRTAIAQPNGSIQLQRLQDIRLDGYRIPMKWNNGNIVSSAVEGPQNISGNEWISKLREIGAKVIIVIGGNHKNNDINPEDAANMVRYFKDRGTPIKEWIIGNEPSLDGLTIEQYCAMFNNIADAMKAVDPTIKVGGPAWASYDLNALRTFVQLSGTRADIVDYHHYAMGESFLDEAEALLQTRNYENEIREIRDMIKAELPEAEYRMEIQLGEYNWSFRRDNGYPGWKGDDRFYKAVTTVWAATVAGLFAKNGGRSFQYSDLNGALGLTFENSEEATHFGKNINDPNPIYWGLFMFTGGNLFRHFGNEFVQATTTHNKVAIFASKSKNVVIINQSPNSAKTVHFNFDGLPRETVAEIWQTSHTNPFDPPVNKGTHPIRSGKLIYTLPAYSVTTLVIK